MARNEGPPEWMQERSAESRPPKGFSRQPTSYIKSDLGQQRSQRNPTPSLGAATEGAEMRFPQSVITGVKIIAALMLLNTWFAFSFGMVSIFEPSGTEMRDSFSGSTYAVVTFSDYFSFWRVSLSTVLAAGLSIITWKIVSHP